MNFYEHTWQLLLKVDENSSQKLTCLCKENLPLMSISAEHLEEGHQAYPGRLNPNIVMSGVTSSGRQKAVWASPALDVFLKFLVFSTALADLGQTLRRLPTSSSSSSSSIAEHMAEEQEHGSMQCSGFWYTEHVPTACSGVNPVSGLLTHSAEAKHVCAPSDSNLCSKGHDYTQTGSVA